MPAAERSPSAQDPPVGGGLVVRAPAKLNLFLEVLGKRPDGYHEIETLLVSVDLFDTLRVVDDPSGRLTLSCSDPALPTGPENLVWRAAELLRRDAGVERGAAITLEKAIPAQAGLAGGSSDAWATLVALDQLWHRQTPPDRLESLAGLIGSDVAFFRHAPAAIGRGRGERVEPLPLATSFHFVLICPPTGVRTAEVYGRLEVPTCPRPIDDCREAFLAGDPEALGRTLFNRLQPVAEQLHPALLRTREALEEQAECFYGILMSGSGSAYYGLARSREAAHAAARHLQHLGPGLVRVVTCGT